MKKIIFLPILALFVCACNSSENRLIVDDVAAFIEGNSSIAYFGYVDVKSILNKSEYQSIEKFGSEIAKEVVVFEKLIGKDQPIYFAAESTIDLKQTVPSVYAFAEVTNRDSLVSNIQKKGFDMEKSKAYDLHESGDVAFAVTNNRVIFVTKPGLKEGKKVLESAIEDLQGKCPANKVKDILSAKGDIVFGTDFSASYQGFEKNINLDESRKKELQKMTENCYSQAVLSFEIGVINLEMKNFISDEMKAVYALGSNSENVVSRLGSGPVQAAFVMNADMKKIQSFIDRFAPNLMEEIGENAGGQAQFALAMLGDEGLAGLFSGKFGVALMGKPDDSGAFKPEFNFYVELGKSILPMARGFTDGLGESMAKIELNGSNLNGFTSTNFLPGKSGLVLPKECENFGEKPICGFINFEGLDMSNFDLDGNERYLKLLRFIDFELDTEGGTIHVEVREKKKNVLKVFVDEATQDIKDRVNS
jgi:hypothetical protein